MGIRYSDLPNYANGSFPDDTDSLVLNDNNGAGVPITRKVSLQDLFRSRGGGSWKYRNTSDTLFSGDNIVADISTNGITLTLPTSNLYTSDEINIIVRPSITNNRVLSLFTSTIPINGNSSLSYVYASKANRITFVYINPIIGWVVTSNSTDLVFSDRGTKNVDIKGWTGNGSVQTISDISVKPDLAIIKNYTGSVEDWIVCDSNRSPTNSLSFHNTTAETIRTNTIIALSSNKVVLNGGMVNSTNKQYVGYFFRQNSSVGMDIITYTGTAAASSFYHSLDGEPEFVIVKYLSTALGGTAPATLPGWFVYHKSMLGTPETRYMLLNTNAAPITSTGTTGAWNSLKPSSSQLNVGTLVGTGSNLHRYVAYLFRTIPGVSMFGSYVGNGDSGTPPEITFDFKPRLLFIKNASAIGEWVWIDTIRNTLDLADKALLSTSNGIEVSGDAYSVTLLPNGFKPTATSTFNNVNALNNVYIYGAWA